MRTVNTPTIVSVPRARFLIFSVLMTLGCAPKPWVKAGCDPYSYFAGTCGNHVAPSTAPAAAPNPVAPAPPPVLSPGVADVLSRVRLEILKLTNEERADHSVSPLRADARLDNAAQGHAEYMLRTGDFAHDTKDGSDPSERTTRAGYGPYGGENIFMGPRSASEAVQGWMNSSGHRANILRPSFVHLGVGLACRDIRTMSECYWVQSFGIPK